MPRPASRGNTSRGATQPGAPKLRIPPRDPREAVATFKVRDGFRLDLLAAEPLVCSPVAMEYDENGRAYVAEMRDYPYTDRSTDKPMVERTTDLPLGRVRLLEDTDGDGRFDRSAIFADNLSWPTGLALWKGGVYVAATPDLWYLKDTDGDGRADVRRKVFTGFRKLNVQAVINNLRWGLDHMIYGAGGSNGGSIRRGNGRQEAPVTMSAEDFRFDPESERIEFLSGGARFGLAFDDWGRRFVCNIRNPIRHAVIEDRYLGRNRWLPAVSPLQDVAEAGDTLPIFRISPPEPWRVLNARRLAADPTTPSPRSETVAAGYVTAACGLTIYRGAAYPAEYYGQAFLGEVAANVIHRQRLKPDGLTFRSERIDQAVEFAASTDNWFRPVNFTNAPDGTLHVLDMYRETIEHPWSIPDDIKQGLDLQSGRDRGRIYRLAPPDFLQVPRPHLGSAGIHELLAALENPNSWWRDTAHRLIFERQDEHGVGLLRSLLRSRASDPRAGPPLASLARLHAVWSLQGLRALTDEDKAVALGDPTPEVREHAIRIAEPELCRSDPLLKRVLALAEDAHTRVRGQVALSIGGLTDVRVIPALAAIACRDPSDPWIRAAALTAVPQLAASLVEALARAEFAPLPTLQGLATTVGAGGSDEEVHRVLQAIGPAGPSDFLAVKRNRREAVIGLCEGVARKGRDLVGVAERIDPAASGWLSALIGEAAALAADPQSPVADRLQNIRLIGMNSSERAHQVLAGLLGPQQPQEVQLAAIEALARQARPGTAELLLAACRATTPGVREVIVHQLLSRGQWLRPLLDAISIGTLAPADVPLNRRAILLRSADVSLRTRALALFAREGPAARGEVLTRYRGAIQLQADADRGRLVARRVCMNCHRVRGEGIDVAPPLETIQHRSPEEVLTQVLDPNREVSPSYFEYVVTFKDGRVTTGAIAAETPTSITLRRAGGASETILRADIDELASTGKSLMPEGLENQVTPQEMADLIRFLLQRD
jgi:putative membrane-bound dehydrogenase-like protein